MLYQTNEVFLRTLAIFLFGSVTAASTLGYSTFIYPTNKGNLTFALSAAKGGSVYVHLSAPADYSWVGVGTGREMDGSVMWIVYRGKNKDSITLSQRLSHGNVEPSYSERIDCTLLDGAHYKTIDKTQYYTADVRCTNLTSIGEGLGRLNMNQDKQEFLYAFGPEGSVGSDSPSAGIKRHDSYGNFWVDMTKSQVTDGGEASAPSRAALTETTNAGPDGSAQSDGDKIGPAHAAIMLATFVIIFPLGAVLLRLMENVRAHYITQSIGVFVSIVGLGLGIYLGTMYNKSKDFATGHQIFGFIITALVLLQWPGGLIHHLQYRRHTKSGTLGRLHRYLGPIVVICGIVNGFLGFHLSGNDDDYLWYGIVMGVIIATVIVVLGWKRWSNHNKREANKTPGDRGFDHSEYRMNLIKRLHGSSGSNPN